MCYEPGMDADRETRNELELDLRAAIEAGDLTVAFQPLVSAASREIVARRSVGADGTGPATARFRPSYFIPIAETTGLIEPLGPLRAAARPARRRMQWPESVNIAVNISPGQFRNPAFADHVGAMYLHETGTMPRA